MIGIVFTTTNIINQGGAGLLQKYRCSKSKLFQTNYPEHSWNFSKQKKAPDLVDSGNAKGINVSIYGFTWQSTLVFSI
jgi:hypothetical protein